MDERLTRVETAVRELEHSARTIERWLSALFHALVTSMVGLPVLREAVTRFKLLGPGASALVMTALTGASLAVAICQRLQIVAWIVVLPAVTMSLMMIAATGFVLPSAVDRWMATCTAVLALRRPSKASDVSSLLR